MEIELLDSVKYLYLHKITEPRDNALRIIVQEAVDNPPVPEERNKNWTYISRIESTETCRTFELVWKRYVAYLVTEEVVGSCGQADDEVYSGKLFRTYTESHFLEHLARDTGAHTEPVLHFKVLCLNHLIDVGAYARPEIRELPSESHEVRVIH